MGGVVLLMHIALRTAPNTQGVQNVFIMIKELSMTFTPPKIYEF